MSDAAPGESSTPQPPPPPRAPVAHRDNAHCVKLVVLVLLIAGVVGWFVTRDDEPPPPPPPPAATPAPTPTLTVEQVREAQRKEREAKNAAKRQAWLLKTYPRIEPELAKPFEQADETAAGRLLERLRRGAHAEADALLAAERKKGRLKGAIDDHLTRALHQLESRPEFAERFAAWIKARPQSVYAHLARGRFRIKAAWAARGGGWASTVTPGGWKGFAEHLQGAKADLQRAHELDPKLPHASAMLVTVAMGLQEDEGPFFLRAIQADPTFYYAYLQRMWSLLPRWGGSEAEALKIADDAIAANPKEPAFRLLRAAALLAIDEDRHPSPRIERDLAAAEAAYPRSGRVARRYSKYYRKVPAKYAEWLRKGAERGHPEAARYWALALHHGRGVEVDLPAAFRWYRRAAVAGHVPAITDCGIVVQRLIASDPKAPFPKSTELNRLRQTRYATARQWYERGIACGNTWSLMSLAEMLASGKHRPDKLGRPQPQPYDAADLMRTAIKRGHPRARQRLKRHLWRFKACRKPGDPK